MKFWKVVLIILAYVFIFVIAGIAVYYTPELYKLSPEQAPFYLVPPLG